jgi:DNA-binding response OmpR family regulator
MCHMPSGRMLVVDDDQDVRDLIVATLVGAGYTTEAVGDGRAALDSYAARTPDVMVLDVEMPELTGLDVCAAVKSGSAPADCAVMLVSAASAEQDLAAGYQAGADDYLVKPFSPRELVHRIEALLRRG